MPDVKMPKLSDTMEEGTVLEWKKKDGEAVKQGEALAEIESDKASFDIEAESDGVLSIVVDKGVPAKVGALIARIGAPGAEKPPAKPAVQPVAPAAKQTEKQPAKPAGVSSPLEGEVAPARSARASGGAVGAPPADESEPAAALPEGTEPDEPTAGADAGVKASPLAKRLAAEMGVDLSSITGTGPDGRIVKEDVLHAKSTKPASARKPSQAPASSERDSAASEAVQPNRMQATIARRMTESKATVPHFYVTVGARVDEAVRLRSQLKESVPGADKVTMTDMLVRACALALRKFPECNASWIDGRFVIKSAINIGLAVAPSEGMGLLVPIVHDADRKDLIQISIEARQAIERARSGRPAEGDLTGGTFSISNLGMYGVDEFNAIINPPEAAILAVGAIKDAAVVDDGKVVAGKLMRMTLSVDHRVFYGATAAQFMAEVKRLIESPVTLVVPPE